MRRCTRKSAIAVVLACATGACAAVEQLDEYSRCTVDCDTGNSPANSGGPDATKTEDVSDDGSETGALGPDGNGSTNDGAADAEEGGDAGARANDAGEGADATDAGHASDAGDAGHSIDASDAAGAADAADASSAADGEPATCAVSGVDAGLLVYYPFEGNTDDLSGNGNTGLAVTGTDITFGAGKLGQGVTIKAGGQGVGVTGGTPLSGAKTLCAWVNPATGTAGPALPVFTGGMNYYDVLTSFPTAGGCLGLTANTLFMDNGACSTTTVAVTPGSWNLVCFAYGVGSTTFYANGASQAVTGNQSDPYLLLQITVGSNRSGGSTTSSLFVGQIDEVSIWSGWLTGAAMNSLYNSGNGCRIR